MVGFEADNNEGIPLPVSVAAEFFRYPEFVGLFVAVAWADSAMVFLVIESFIDVDLAPVQFLEFSECIRKARLLIGLNFGGNHFVIHMGKIQLAPGKPRFQIGIEGDFFVIPKDLRESAGIEQIR